MAPPRRSSLSLTAVCFSLLLAAATQISGECTPESSPSDCHFTGFGEFTLPITITAFNIECAAASGGKGPAPSSGIEQDSPGTVVRLAYRNAKGGRFLYNAGSRSDAFRGSVAEVGGDDVNVDEQSADDLGGARTSLIAKDIGDARHSIVLGAAIIERDPSSIVGGEAVVLPQVTPELRVEGHIRVRPRPRPRTQREARRQIQTDLDTASELALYSV